jgi:transposase
MLMLPRAVRIYLAVEPCDMRKSFRGLSGLVRGHLRSNPLSGHVYCFINLRATMLKCLVHDGSGYVIYYKRLSKGTFQLPTVSEGAQRIQIDAGTLALILEGIDLNGVKRRLRYHHGAEVLAES